MHNQKYNQKRTLMASFYLSLEVNLNILFYLYD